MPADYRHGVKRSTVKQQIRPEEVAAVYS
ncbi:hypothetical protein BIW11_04498 [Tropilaelaps mercedesae]|uniref:Uncharacterized protein n=1 Tax=Tropilaelaps mercedesae TaxID=418985 RepID=A0A1V9X5L9_9ACAR|nr:hypothetical protein BIW11_04498 [Tropilaelaps mercedesae]